METMELLDKVKIHISEYIDADLSHLTLDSHLFSVIPGLDSLKLYEMLLYLEECFNIDFDESAIDHLETMRDIVTYIQTLIQSKKVSV